MKKNFLKIALALFLIGAALTAAIFGANFFAKYQQPKNQIKLYGNIDIKEVSTSFRVAGRLKNLYFDEGDFVKKDELLAELESDTFENDLELAKANLEATVAQLENAQKKFARTKKLFASDSASRQEFDNDKAALNEVKARVEAQKTQTKIAQPALDDTKLRAPLDAFVMTRAFEIGSMLTPNQSVYELSLTNQAYVRAYVDEKDLGKILNGLAVKIQTDSGSEYDGQIGFISSKAEFTPKSVETSSLRTSLVYRLRIEVKNPDTKLKQGMPVTILLKI